MRRRRQRRQPLSLPASPSAAATSLAAATRFSKKARTHTHTLTHAWRARCKVKASTKKKESTSSCCCPLGRRCLGGRRTATPALCVPFSPLTHSLPACGFLCLYFQLVFNGGVFLLARHMSRNFQLVFKSPMTAAARSRPPLHNPTPPPPTQRHGR